MGEPEIVWLFEESRYATLVRMGAFYSTVRYTENGMEYEIMVENNDFETWEEHAVEYTED